MLSKQQLHLTADVFSFLLTCVLRVLVGKTVTYFSEHLLNREQMTVAIMTNNWFVELIQNLGIIYTNNWFVELIQNLGIIYTNNWFVELNQNPGIIYTNNWFAELNQNPGIIYTNN